MTEVGPSVAQEKESTARCTPKLRNPRRQDTRYFLRTKTFSWILFPKISFHPSKNLLHHTQHTTPNQRSFYTSSTPTVVLI